MRRVVLAGLLILVASRAYAGPDLYLDGDALANAVTPWILANTQPAARTARTPQKMWWKLWNGDAFLGDDHPQTKALREWLLEQPDASVTPHALYQKAIGLEGGNVERGLMLVWDSLRAYYGSRGTRNELPYIKKLVDITGELDQFRKHDLGRRSDRMHTISSSVPFLSTLAASRRAEKLAVRGDNFSAWYHFAGTALSSYSVASSRGLKSRLGLAKLHTNAMVFMEEFVLFNEWIDPIKRRQIDWAGTNFGTRLARNLRRYPTVQAFQRSPDAARTTYLYDNPKVYGERWRLKDGQKPWEWRDPKSLGQRVRRIVTPKPR